MYAALALGSVMWLAASADAFAIPRFAARNGAHCTLCHINPSGGGARNDYGRDVFEKTRLGIKFLDVYDAAMAGRKKDPAPEGAPAVAEGRARGLGLSGAITEWLTLGADLRLGFLWVEELKDEDGAIINSANTPGIGFFLMQADLYLAAELGRFMTFYLDKGKGTGWEAWALWNQSGIFYLKAGYFTPPHGLRLEEHRAYITEDLALGGLARDVGLEGSLLLGPLMLNVAFAYPFTGGLGGGRSMHPDGGIGLYSTLTVAHSFKPLSLIAGVSASMRTRTAAATPLISGRYLVPGGPSATELAGVREGIFGAFLGVTIGRFTYIAEADLVVNHRFVNFDEDNDPDTPDIAVLDSTEPCGDDTMDPMAPALCGRFWGLAVYHELSFQLLQGIDLIGTFEYRDIDLELRSGAETRYGGGIELFITPFTELKLMYRHRRASCAGTIDTDGDGRGDTCLIRSLPTHGEDEITIFVHAFF